MPRLRRTPLIVVTSPTPGAAERVVERLRQDGAVAFATHSAEGCLRVSTSIGPDVILIDAGLPRRARSRLTRLLRAHPISAHAQLRQLADAAHAAGVERTAHLVAA